MEREYGGPEPRARDGEPPEEAPEEQRARGVQKDVDDVIADGREPPEVVLGPEGREDQGIVLRPRGRLEPDAAQALGAPQRQVRLDVGVVEIGRASCRERE